MEDVSLSKNRKNKDILEFKVINKIKSAIGTSGI